jgi:hypothetical protein
MVSIAIREEDGRMSNNSKKNTDFQWLKVPAALTGVILLGVGTLPASANPAYGNPRSNAPNLVADTPVNAPVTAEFMAHDANFRAANPFRVFIQLREGNRAQRDGNQQQGQSLSQLAHLVPSYVTLTGTPEHTDMKMRVKETSYNLRFRVINTRNKNKKYKKSRRYSGGPCGNYKRAFFRKIKEKGEAYADYSVSINLRGAGRNRDHFTLRSAKNFSYGTDLTASSKCGIQPTRQMPSNGVAKLFNRAGEGYRHGIAQKVRVKTSLKLSRQLAQRINVQADYFYTNLAQRIIAAQQEQQQRQLYSQRSQPQPSQYSQLNFGGRYRGFNRIFPRPYGGYRH